MRSPALLLAFVFGCRALAVDVELPEKPTQEERSFMQVLCAAFEKSDEKLLLEVSHWKDGDEQPFFLRDFYTTTISQKAKRIRLDRVDPMTHTERKKNGTMVKDSLPVQWVVTVVHPSDYDVKTIMNAGVLAGRIRLTTTYVLQK